MENDFEQYGTLLGSASEAAEACLDSASVPSSERMDIVQLSKMICSTLKQLFAMKVYRQIFGMQLIERLF